MPPLFDRYGEAGENHKGSLFFNPRALGSLPFRGKSPSPPPLRDEEFDELEVAGEFYCRTFDLSDQSQHAEYQKVMNRVANGWYRCAHRHHHFDPQTKAMAVYVEWVQLYKEAPPHLEAQLRQEEARRR